MKKGKIVFLLGILSFLLPFSVKAKEAVNVYMFKGATCPHCANALEFFNSLKEDEEFKDIFNLVEYEVWKDQANRALAEEVAEKLGDKFSGVPYIIIGDKSHSGYSASLDETIKKEIKDYYNQDENSRYDVLASAEKPKSNIEGIIAVGIVVVAIAGIGYIIYLSRKDSTPVQKEKPVVKEKTEEIKKNEEKVEQEESKESKEEKETKEQKPKKTNSTKKTGTKKKATKRK